MTQEDKDLLLKDLCARLPHDVMLNISVNKYTDKTFNAIISAIDYCGEVKARYGFEEYEQIFSIEQIKPYLFPLSSMTEEQRQEFLSVAGYERREEDCGRHTETYYYDMVGHEHNFYPNSDAIDWLNKNHFDYRGLIEKGLAIDATGLNVY